MSKTAVYVFCVIAAARRPRAPAKTRPLPGLGPVRILDVDGGTYLVVADAPLSRYSEDAINRGLADLEWVSRAAVAHESVIESFVDETAILPMKLFTIFTSDARALEHIAQQRTRIASLVKRVANNQEWGVRLVLDRRAAERASASSIGEGRAAAPAGASGAAYLTRKKAQRDAAVELASRAHDIVARLYDRLEARSKLAKRRAASELPVKGGPLLLDAAFLVPKARAASFKALAAREARGLSKQGYAMTVTGPWPPYTFVQE
jgi:Gas vesicle synthesis protein GvpL/GvpF